MRGLPPEGQGHLGRDVNEAQRGPEALREGRGHTDHRGRRIGSRPKRRPAPGPAGRGDGGPPAPARARCSPRWPRASPCSIRATALRPAGRHDQEDAKRRAAASATMARSGRTMQHAPRATSPVAQPDPARSTRPGWAATSSAVATSRRLPAHRRQQRRHGQGPLPARRRIHVDKGVHVGSYIARSGQRDQEKDRPGRRGSERARRWPARAAWSTKRPKAKGKSEDDRQGQASDRAHQQGHHPHAVRMADERAREQGVDEGGDVRAQDVWIDVLAAHVARRRGGRAGRARPRPRGSGRS